MLLPLILVLLSALCHAAWNVLFKRSADPRALAVGIPAVSLAATAALIPFLPGPAFPRPAGLAWGAAAGGFEALYFMTLARAMAQAPLGWSYAWMRGGALLLVWPLSLAFLGEPARPPALAGAAAVLAGLLLMGGGSRRGLGWIGVVAAAIAGYTLCYKLSLGHGAQPVPLFALSMSVSLPLQLALRADRGGLRLLDLRPRRWAPVAAAGLLSAASFTLYLAALGMAGAGAMTTLRNTSVVFTLVLASLLGERSGPRAWLGAGLVAAGAAGLAWPA